MTLLTVVLAGTVTALACVVNQLQARVGLVEVALNEGLPPGHERNRSRPATLLDDSITSARLSPGTHVFLSRSCVACQRLLDELRHRPLGLDQLTLHYIDRPRPEAAEAAAVQGATLVPHQADLARTVGANPLPHTIAVGPHALVAATTTPTCSHVLDTAAAAGLAAR